MDRPDLGHLQETQDTEFSDGEESDTTKDGLLYVCVGELPRTVMEWGVHWVSPVLLHEEQSWRRPKLIQASPGPLEAGNLNSV